MPQNTPPPIKSLPRRWLTVGAGTYVIPANESGLGFTNAGADGPTTFVLPTAWQGRNFAFFNAAGQTITVQRAVGSADQINVQQVLSTSIDDGGATGAYLVLEAPGQLFWNAVSASAAFLPAAGLPYTSGTFTAQANPVIPFVAGHRLFRLTVFDITSNMAPSDGNQWAFQTSANLNGSSPDTGNNYLNLIGANSANSPGSNMSGGHWNGTGGGAQAVQVSMSIDLGDANSRFLAYGGCDQIGGDDTRTLFNLQWYKTNMGLVQSLVMLPANVEPAMRFSGSWIAQAISSI